MPRSRPRPARFGAVRLEQAFRPITLTGHTRRTCRSKAGTLCNSVLYGLTLSVGCIEIHNVMEVLFIWYGWRMQESLFSRFVNLGQYREWTVSMLMRSLGDLDEAGCPSQVASCSRPAISSNSAEEDHLMLVPRIILVLALGCHSLVGNGVVKGSSIHPLLSSPSIEAQRTYS